MKNKNFLKIDSYSKKKRFSTTRIDQNPKFDDFLLNSIKFSPEHPVKIEPNIFLHYFSSLSSDCLPVNDQLSCVPHPHGVWGKDGNQHHYSVSLRCLPDRCVRVSTGHLLRGESPSHYTHNLGLFKYDLTLLWGFPNTPP